MRNRGWSVNWRSQGGLGSGGEPANATGRASTALGALWLGLAGLVVIGKLGTFWWWFDLAAHFRLQYFLAALGLGGAAIGLRCWKWALASLGLAAVLGYTLLPFWVGTGNLPTGFDRLRVLSINVLSSNLRTELLREVLAREEPDLVVIQEFSREWAESLRWMESDYPYRCLEPRRGNFGMAVMSRRPLHEVRVLELGTGGPLSIAVTVDVDGRPWTVCGVHTFPPVSREASAARNMHLAELARLVRDDSANWVVMGDLNCTSWSPWFEKFTAETRLCDSRLGLGVQGTWPAGPVWLAPLRIPIDHCLVSPSVGVAARRVTTGVGSDHLGVVVDLGWSEGRHAEPHSEKEISR